MRTKGIKDSWELIHKSKKLIRPPRLVRTMYEETNQKSCDLGEHGILVGYADGLALWHGRNKVPRIHWNIKNVDKLVSSWKHSNSFKISRRELNLLCLMFVLWLSKFLCRPGPISPVWGFLYWHNSSLVVDERIQDGHKNLVQLLEKIYKNSLKKKASTKSTQGLNKKERCQRIF